MIIRIPKPGLFRRKIFKNIYQRKISINAEEISDVLGQYGITSWEFLKTLKGGNSDNFLLQTAEGKKVLKRYLWSLPSIIHEHSVHRYLLAKNFSCAPLVFNKMDSSYSEFGRRYYALYDFIEGYCCTDYYIRPKNMQRFISLAGIKLAEYHQLMAGFVPQGMKQTGLTTNGFKSRRDDTWHLTVLDQYLGRYKDKSSFNETAVFMRKISDELKKIFLESAQDLVTSDPHLTILVIHGDYQPRNVLFDQGRIAGVLDFGDANLNLSVVDITRGLSTFCRNRNHLFNENCVKAFLGSYQSKQTLSPSELAAIPDFIIRRNLKNIIGLLHGEMKNHKNRRHPKYQFMKIQKKWRTALRVKRHAPELQKMFLSTANK